MFQSHQFLAKASSKASTSETTSKASSAKTASKASAAKATSVSMAMSVASKMASMCRVWIGDGHCSQDSRDGDQDREEKLHVLLGNYYNKIFLRRVQTMNFFTVLVCLGPLLDGFDQLSYAFHCHLY